MSYVTNVHKDARVVRAVDIGKKFKLNLSLMDFEQTWKEQIVYIHTNQIWIDLFRRNPYVNTNWPDLFQLPNAEIMSYVLNTLFKPIGKMLEHLNSFFDMEVQSKEFVCAHVRQGREPSSVDKVIQFIKTSPSFNRDNIKNVKTKTRKILFYSILYYDPTVIIKPFCRLVLFRLYCLKDIFNVSC